MQTQTIHQTVSLPCTAETAFNAWLDSKIHSEMINAKAVIEPKIGGKFSIWDDYITGKTVEIDKKALKIVQEWRDNDSDWPDGHFSTVSLVFEKDTSGSHIVFMHEGIPEKHIKSIKDGWNDYYWKPMKAYFGSH